MDASIGVAGRNPMKRLEVALTVIAVGVLGIALYYYNPDLTDVEAAAAIRARSQRFIYSKGKEAKALDFKIASIACDPKKGMEIRCQVVETTNDGAASIVSFKCSSIWKGLGTGCIVENAALLQLPNVRAQPKGNVL